LPRLEIVFRRVLHGAPGTPPRGSLR
jgi:hypothetical protein